jgi:hypothetical protein
VIKSGTLTSRLVAVALLVLVLVAIATAVVSPLVERWVQLRDERADAIELAGRFRAIARARDKRAAELAAVKREVAGSGIYLEAESRALAAAQMREILKAAVADHGGEVRSVRVLEGGDTEGEAQRISLNVVMRGRWSELFPILYSLEAGSPRLFITEFTIGSRRRRRRRRVQIEDTEPVMEMKFALHGYLPREIAG